MNLPIPRLDYEEASLRYGTDKPDLRYGMEIVELGEIAENSDFQIFSGAIGRGGAVRAISVPGAAGFSRKNIDELTKIATELGARGLAHAKYEGGELTSGISKFFGDSEAEAYLGLLKPEEGSLILFVADKPEICAKVLGALRVRLAERLDLADLDKWEAHFVVNFPMFEYDEETGRPVAKHHPFTQPLQEDLPLLEEDPMKVRARAYDLVLNGHEIAGGSIRIHTPELLTRVLSAIRIPEEKAREKFGFLMDAFRYGVPPHGGIAFGYDRMVMLLAGRSSIRDVIAFPKTTAGQSLMDGSPGRVDEKQLADIGIEVLENRKEAGE